MKLKRVKIPFNKKCVINRRSISNSRKNPTENQELLNKTNSYKIIQNTSDIDTSRNETTIESSVETIKRIIIYKKNISRPKNNLNIIKENSNNDKKDNTNQNFSLNNNLIRSISAKALFKKTNIKKNNFKFQKNTRNKDIKDILNNSTNINDRNAKTYYFGLTRNSENKEEKENINNNKTIFNRFFPSINEYKKEPIRKNNEFINIEDLMLLEEMFRGIITMNSNLSNECFEFINFYNHSSLYNKFENFFTYEISKNIVHLSILKMLFSLVLLYHYSFNDSLYKKNHECLKTMIKLNYKSFLLICECISNKISVKEADNIWVKKLKLMIKYNLKHINKENSKEFKAYLLSKGLKITPNKNINSNVIEIKYYLFLIQKNINILLRNLPKSDERQNEFHSIEARIPNLSGGEIINFFRRKIIRIKNKNGSVYGNDISFYEPQNFVNLNIKIPYLNYTTKKKFTLVLDLDETLISFKIIDNIKNINKGILRFRPGIYEFLFSVKMNYELIIFTSATKEYADPLIDAIEKKMKYFDFRLYREHTIIWENEFVKDIGRLGRPMNKLIIVDNLPQNFKLQKENGIMIKPFWGEDVYDNVLHELSIILNKIASEFYDTRKGIIKYKNDILSKVSSCFSRSEIYEK